MHLKKMFPLVILAAGEGRRMGEVKPLVRLLGLTLLERAILNFREAGINKFYVVVGYKKKEVKKHIEKIREKYGVDVEVIENEEWKKGNGTSVLAVHGHVKKFFVTMVDHVFEANVIKDFVEGVNGEKCQLLVDRNVENVFDIEEATKVKMGGERIVDIGKELKEYDAIDTGLFFFTDEIFEAMEKAIRKGKAGVTDGVKILAEKGKMYGYAKNEGYWIDTDTKDALKTAERLILKSIPKKEDGFISFYLNRRFSLKISSKLCNFNISPNILTIVSFLIAVAGSMLFIFGRYLYTVLGGIAIQIASIIDGCDGEIARMKFLASEYGAWLDTILDRYADAIIVILVTYNGWMIYRENIIWVLGFFSLLGFIMASYSRKEYELRYGKKMQDSVMNKLSKRDIRLFSVFLGSLFNMAFEFMVVIAMLHHVALLWNLLRRKK